MVSTQKKILRVTIRLKWKLGFRLTFIYGKRQTASEVFDFYNSIIMAFTKVLKYIKQLLNLWYFAIIQESKLITTSHVFTKAVNYDLAFEVYVWRINFMF